MRSTDLLWRAATRLARVVALCTVVLATASGAKHPRYGGTLRIELREAALSFDPRTWRPGTLESAASEKLAALLFDRLVALDNHGHFRPQLASEWAHDSESRRWQFHLREGVKFSDDSPLTALDVAAALQPLLPSGIQVSGTGNAITLLSSRPLPDALELLASGPFFIYGTARGGTLVGTGPFFVAETSSSNSELKTIRYVLKANEACWSGRPFVDAIELSLGLPALRRLLDWQLGKADLIEVAPELVRRARQESLRVWASAPVITYALRIDTVQPAGSNAALREALSHSLDRATVANVLLQKQAEPAATLLPQWLSGYAFLFDVDTNLERAKELRATLPSGLASGWQPLHLQIEAPGELAKLVAERVAVNARQAGIGVQVLSRPMQREGSTTPATGSGPTLHLFAWHVESLSPRIELDTLLKSMAITEPTGTNANGADVSQVFNRERQIMAERTIFPIVSLPEYTGIGANVRNWLPSPWGEWHLADVWLDSTESNAAETSAAPDSRVTNSRPAVSPAASGAKP